VSLGDFFEVYLMPKVFLKINIWNNMWAIYVDNNITIKNIITRLRLIIIK